MRKQLISFAVMILLQISFSIKVTPNFPTRVMIGYWQTWGTSGNPFIKLRDICMSWDIINIAFAVPVQPGSKDGKMKFSLDVPDYSESEFISDIKLMQSKGKKIVLAIGGYEGYFTLQEPGAVDQFVSDIKGFINKFGFDGIDIDLEQHSIDFDQGNDQDIRVIKSPILANLVEAIRKIKSGYGKDFILSWAPETFYVQMGYTYYAGINPYCDARAGSYLPMINQLREETTFLHVQLYNSGAIQAPDGIYYTMGNKAAVVAMCKMVLEGFYVGAGTGVAKTEKTWFAPLRPDQVVIGVPASQGAAGSGQIPNAELQDAFRELNAKFSPLRGIMAWDINWDTAQNRDSFANENRAFLNTL